jgi:16S rRNA C967 or C1407 C5-methylase (RsmB/RsmF family)
MRRTFGEERFERFLKAMDEEPTVSIRVNPRKAPAMVPVEGEPVGWCRGGYYLSGSSAFTFDPLFHAGCYYVQEASSMFLDEVLRQHLPQGTLTALDLCAAPGGKSTLLRSALTEESLLYSNEPVRKRASILLENVVKWGYERHVVTNNYPRDYRREKMLFDVILCDVPCSGEGMFRKDPDAVGEWSLKNVAQCQQLQREIVSDAWACLAEGGLLIYSTCTYNTKENEENISWMMEELDAEVLPVKTNAAWGITGSLLEGFDAPVYRFIPGFTRGEGLFMAVVRKEERGERREKEERGERREERMGARQNRRRNQSGLSILSPLSTLHSPLSLPLSYPQSLSYLRGEAIVLPEDAPRGIVGVSFMGHELGQVKNIGSRANNLYPKEWRIKTTHIPQEYETILRLA